MLEAKIGSLVAKAAGQAAHLLTAHCSMPDAQCSMLSTLDARHMVTAYCACALCTAYCLLLTTRQSSSHEHCSLVTCLLLAPYCVLLAVCFLLLNAYSSLLTDNYLLLPIRYHLLPTTFHVPPSTYHMPPTSHHLQPTTCYLPPTTCHPPPTTHHLAATTCLPLSTFCIPPSPSVEERLAGVRQRGVATQNEAERRRFVLVETAERSSVARDDSRGCEFRLRSARQEVSVARGTCSYCSSWSTSCKPHLSHSRCYRQTR